MSAEREPLLSVRGLRSGYGETTIVRDVDLDVHEGEAMVIVGPNGHGKSTLLRTITGLLPATAGEVRFAGQRIDGLPAERLTATGLVHIPQGDHLFPDLTVEENLLMGAFPKASWRARSTAIAHVFELFPKLWERRAQRSRTLSGGERRMVAIGRGLMREPRLLVIDEPSLGLAPVIVEQVYAIITAVAREQGTPILLVEENFTHVEELADRVGVLEMGRIVRTGPPAELAADPEITQSYLGALPS